MGMDMDAAIGTALGHQVLGYAEVYAEECGTLYLPFDHVADTDVKRPVYLGNCCCELREPTDIDYFGHTARCLKIEPRYSWDITAAFQLVSQMPYFSLMRRGKIWQCQSRFCGNWMDHSLDKCSCIIEEGETAAQAICRAFLKLKGIDDV